MKNAEVLARLLKGTKHRKLIVVSFQQAAVDRFHELAPRIDLAPGIDGAANWLLAGGSPGPGVVAFQVPITFTTGGTTLEGHHRRERRRAHTRGLRLAELVLERGQRRARHLAQPDRHVRGRHDDLAPRRVRAGAEAAPAPRLLRLSDFAHKAARASGSASQTEARSKGVLRGRDSARTPTGTPSSDRPSFRS